MRGVVQFLGIVYLIVHLFRGVGLGIDVLPFAVGDHTTLPEPIHRRSIVHLTHGEGGIREMGRKVLPLHRLPDIRRFQILGMVIPRFLARSTQLVITHIFTEPRFAGFFRLRDAIYGGAKPRLIRPYGHVGNHQGHIP